MAPGKVEMILAVVGPLQLLGDVLAGLGCGAAQHDALHVSHARSVKFTEQVHEHDLVVEELTLGVHNREHIEHLFVAQQHLKARGRRQGVVDHLRGDVIDAALLFGHRGDVCVSSALPCLERNQRVSRSIQVDNSMVEMDCTECYTVCASVTML